MLAAIFSKNHSQLFQYNFEYIELLVSGHTLKIEPIDEKLEDEGITIRSLKYYIDSKALESLFSFTFSCDDGISFNKVRQNDFRGNSRSYGTIP